MFTICQPYAMLVSMVFIFFLLVSDHGINRIMPDEVVICKTMIQPKVLSCTHQTFVGVF